MTPSPGRSPFVVRAPATSANLGPGFDCLGLAIDLWNEVRVTPADRTLVLAAPGSTLPPTRDNLALTAARVLAEEVGQSLPRAEWCCINRIPSGRGLGSSAAAIVSGLTLANQLLGGPCDPDGLLDLAVRIEGHPDNVTPALFGGVRVSVRGSDGRIAQTEVPLAEPLTLVLFVPRVTLSTARARAALPPTVPYADALFNVARSSLLVAALATGRTDLLAEATRDQLHQPYRASLFPAGTALLRAALEAGAAGACISGAGPTILAFCADRPAVEAVGDAFRQVAAQHQVSGEVQALATSSRGAHVVPAD